MLRSGAIQTMIKPLFLTVILLQAAAFAQQHPSAAFDVASIKPNNTGSGHVGIHSDNGIYNASNVRLRHLLEGAFHIKSELIYGIPAPLDSQHFDISAKIVSDKPGKLNEAEMRSALLQLLEERFGLKAHTESRILPVYELVVAPTGSKLKPSPTADGPTSVNVHNDRDLVAHDDPMSDLASELSDQVHRTVLDKTGLSGHFDFELHWAGDEEPASEANPRPGLFTALQEQLGLKLQSSKGPVDVLIIDHIEPPTEN
jgi:uncharacterized protein (TIGR03435 family)